MVSETVSVHEGDRFEIALREPAATGHRWELTDNPATVASISQRYEAPDPGPIGKPGRRIFTLRATARGRYHIAFELRRPWETSAVAVHHVAVEVY